jgi:hypothetical protein
MSETSICACGKRMSKYYYGKTIKRKKCPRCEMLGKIDGSEEHLSKAFAEKERRGSKSKKKKKSARECARDTADAWFSRYIRIKYNYKIQDGEVYCQCIVNPEVIKMAKKMDNGHMASRKYLTTRYYEPNCRPQNRSSNRFSGEADHYTFEDNLKKQIGQGGIDKIHQLRREVGTDTEEYYKEQSTKYRKLVNDMVKEFEINKWW